jgi:hypothetical protein
MTGQAHDPSQEEVLDAFAVEPVHDRLTLERYLRAHPQYASALCELSLEFARTDLPERQLAADDEELVARAWSQRVALDGVPMINPIGALAPADRHTLARDLGIKTQVLSLFREGRIALETVPRQFLARFADLLETSVDALIRGLGVPAPSTAQAYKSDVRPSVEGCVSFERAIKASGASDDEVAALLLDD